MEEVERTREAALKILMDLRQGEADKMTKDTRSMLSETLLAEIFEQAWRDRFEKDRRHTKAEVRQIVADAIEQGYLSKTP